jgi:alkylglycerol monooxygenase
MEVYAALARDSWRTPHWGDKLLVWFKPPGWRPADLAERFPKPAFDLQAVQRFDPPLATGVAWLAGGQFLALLAGVAAVLWFSDVWPRTQTAVLSAALAACFWALGALLQGRLSVLGQLTLLAAVASTVTSTLGLVGAHQVAKPLTMLLALAVVFTQPASGERGLLCGALLASLAGDVFLMLPGAQWFIPGLASFLVAHLCYIALFRAGTRWFASRGALVATLALGAGMYLVILPGLPDAVMRVAVAAYVVARRARCARPPARSRGRSARPGAGRGSPPGRCLQLRVHAPHQREHLVGRGGVEVAGGLVGQHQRRLQHQRTGDRHALLHAAGQLARALAIGRPGPSRPAGRACSRARR